MAPESDRAGQGSVLGPLLPVLALAMLALLAGCAAWPMHQPYQEKPGQGQRPFWLAHGLMGNALHEHNLVSLNFMKEGGRIYPAIIISRPSANGDGFDLWIHQYRDPGQIEHLDRHWRQRLASPYLKPIQGSFEGRPCWFVLSAMYELTPDIGVDLGWLAARRIRKPEMVHWQLEWYFQDPQAGFALPSDIWTVAVGGEGAPPDADSAYHMNNRFYAAPRIKRGPIGELLSVEVVPWSPPAPLQILAGYRVPTTIDRQWLPAISRILNQRLLEWKTKELAEALPGYSKEQLQDLVVKLEQGLLDIDLIIRKTKEAQDEAARFVPGPGKGQAPPEIPAWVVERSHIFAQRKAIVMAIMDMVKRALAQKR